VSQPSREAHEAEQEEKAKEEGVPEGEVIYRSVRQDGEHALGLSSGALIWSGLAAGLSMGFCLIAKGLLIVHLPHAGWTPLVSSFGYTAGFLIVILGRQQLFTEQTLTAVLPLLARNRAVGSLSNVARLWAIVLVANIVGTAIIAGATALTPAFSQEAQAAFLEIGQKTMSHDLTTTFMRDIHAGYLIAVMVWLLPGAAAARLWIVVLLTYFVGLGELSHVIAGSSDCLYLVFKGERTVIEYVTGFLLPALAGNAVGGVIFVAALAHWQHAPDE